MLFLALLPALMPTVASGQELDSGNDLIKRMSAAMQGLSYTGTFIYSHDGVIETMRIEHTRSQGVERERLLSLNGEAREIVRNAEKVVCVWPGTKKVSITEATPRTPFPDFDSEQLALLEKHYQFKRSGSDRVAGRMTEVVDIKPLDDFRYGYRLWIDAETFLMLRSVMSDMNDRIIEQVMFTDVDYVKDLPAVLFQASLEGERLEWIEGSDPALPPVTDAVIPGVEESSLPDGFSLVSSRIMKLPGDLIARRVMYSDGLASVSVYISQSGSKDSHGLSGMGGVHAFGVTRDKWHATVVGEVPGETVKMFGKNLQLSGI